MWSMTSPIVRRSGFPARSSRRGAVCPGPHRRAAGTRVGQLLARQVVERDVDRADGVDAQASAAVVLRVVEHARVVRGQLERVHADDDRAQASAPLEEVVHVYELAHDSRGASASPTPTRPSSSVRGRGTVSLLASRSVGPLPAMSGMASTSTTRLTLTQELRSARGRARTSSRTPPRRKLGRLAALDRAGQAVGRGDARARRTGIRIRRSTARPWRRSALPRATGAEGGVVEAQVAHQPVGGGDPDRAGGEVADDGELRGRRGQEREVFPPSSGHG